MLHLRLELPDDPVTGTKQMAIAHHELMADYEEAGFDHHEAFTFAVNYAQATAQATAQMLMMKALHHE